MIDIELTLLLGPRAAVAASAVAQYVRASVVLPLSAVADISFEPLARILIVAQGKQSKQNQLAGRLVQQANRLVIATTGCGHARIVRGPGRGTEIEWAPR